MALLIHFHDKVIRKKYIWSWILSMILFVLSMKKSTLSVNFILERIISKNLAYRKYLMWSIRVSNLYRPLRDFCVDIILFFISFVNSPPSEMFWAFSHFPSYDLIYFFYFPSYDLIYCFYLTAYNQKRVPFIKS